MNLTIPVAPMGKPRMTRADRWKQRDCVMRYHTWKDEVCLHVNFRALISEPAGVHIVGYFPLSPSWSKRKKDEMAGKPHRIKPDLDNCMKSIFDTLWPEGDQGIFIGSFEKRWDDGKGPRMEITIT